MLLPKVLPLLGFAFHQSARGEDALLNRADDTRITRALRAYPTPRRNQIINLVIEAIDRTTDVIAASHDLTSYTLSHAIEVARQENMKTAAWTAEVHPALFRSFLLALRSTRIKALNRTRKAKVMQGSYAAKLAGAVDRFNLEVERRGWSEGLTASLLFEDEGGKNGSIKKGDFDFSAPSKMDEKEEDNMIKAVQELNVHDATMEEDMIMG